VRRCLRHADDGGAPVDVQQALEDGAAAAQDAVAAGASRQAERPRGLDLDAQLDQRVGKLRAWQDTGAGEPRKQHR
jgi:hypothetical protein